MTGWLPAATSLLLAPVVLLAAAVGGLAPVAAVGGPTLLGVPERMLAAYLAAADHAPTTPGGCPVPWTVLAAIGEIESGHARGATITSNGDVTPPIVGPALDGSPRVRAIPDTDAGRWDGDAAWDRAVGPMQFLPSTWRQFGRDGSGDGVADPHNADDAALATAVHLCQAPPSPGMVKDLRDEAQLRDALFAYNRSHAYVDRVLAAADRYQTLTQGGVAAGEYTLPVDARWVSRARLSATHHDYPAWDLPLPEGTPVRAVHAGRVAAVTALHSRCGLGVVITGHDGYRYTYCHASAVLVAPRTDVLAGQPILLSGDTGRSAGPHLHLGVRRPDGWAVCPQPLLAAWHAGILAHPTTAPTTGCTH